MGHNASSYEALKAQASADDPAAAAQLLLEARRHNDAFWQLKALLMHSPSPERWQRIAELAGSETALDGVGDDVLSEIDTLIDEGWPASMCVAPQAWIQTLLEHNQHAAGLRLCRAVEYRNAALDGEGLARLLSAPGLARVTHLSLPHNAIGNALEAFLTAKQRLLELNLEHNEIEASGAEILARAPCLNGLERLYLGWSDEWEESILEDPFAEGGNEIGPRGVAALTNSPMLSQLRVLDLSHNGLGDAGVEALAASEHLLQLTDLVLQLNTITSVGLRALAQAPHLPRLKSLNLGNGDSDTLEMYAELTHWETFNRVEVEGLRALLTTERFELHKLYLYASYCERGALSELAAARHLRHLDIDGCNLEEQELITLFQGPGLTQLETLSSRNNAFDDTVADALARAVHMTRLHNLFVGQMRSDNAWLQAHGAILLASAEHLSSLRELGLMWCLEGDAAAKALVASPHWTQLESLDLTLCRLTDETAVAIAEATHLKALRNLDLSSNDIGNEGWRALHESRYLELERLSLSGNRINDVPAFGPGPHLKSLRVGYNYLDDASLKALQAWKLPELDTRGQRPDASGLEAALLGSRVLPLHNRLERARKLNKTQLKQIAKEQGFPVSGMTKAQLIEMLLHNL